MSIIYFKIYNQIDLKVLLLQNELRYQPET